ncbi:MAG: 1-acyl-sn-glycerol-3-phosphate acyltransferase [Magnetococcales bacterium]|nr:1-acyl-sn-glycerol-3-phosphate acyltransferase [Magnetococcales bacterium]
MDGFVYHAAVDSPTFLISTQLRRSLLGRLLFRGIEVVRANDSPSGGESRAINQAAMDLALNHLREGRRLAIFPEGTSDLGPRHLPFHSGAARLAVRCVEQGIPLRLIPLGIHYDCAWCFGSSVEVVIGPTIPLAEETAGMSASSRVVYCKRRITEALGEVGVNFADAGVQQDVERMAFLAADINKDSFFGYLKAWEEGLPPPLSERWSTLFEAVKGRIHLRYRNIPLYPERGLLRTVVCFCLTAPTALLAVCCNIGPVVAVFLAGKYLPDGQNVVALWRILIGVPVLLSWGLIWLGVSLTTAGPALSCGYLLLTCIGLRVVPKSLRSGIALFNALFCPVGSAPFDAVAKVLRKTAVCDSHGVGS